MSEKKEKSPSYLFILFISSAILSFYLIRQVETTFYIILGVFTGLFSIAFLVEFIKVTFLKKK